MHSRSTFLAKTDWMGKEGAGERVECGLCANCITHRSHQSGVVASWLGLGVLMIGGGSAASVRAREPLATLYAETEKLLKVPESFIYLKLLCLFSSSQPSSSFLTFLPLHGNP